MEGFGKSLDLRPYRSFQEQLAKEVRIEPLSKDPKRVGGADVGYAGEFGIAAICVMSWPELEPLEDRVIVDRVRFPYIPGFLSFREVPLLRKAFDSLGCLPDILFVDGQGIAHPRGLGLASHLGVVLGIRTIGCAKKVLVGEARDPGPQRGAFSPLYYRGKLVGALLRTREGVKPICISPGHGIDLEGSIRMVMGATKGFRLPEPIRRAHHLTQLGKLRLLRGGGPNRG